MKLPGSRFGVLVSLPANDVALAEAARDGGADGLKVHVNVSHRASGTVFGSVEEEQAQLRAILDVGLPTGLVVGAGQVSSDQMAAAADMGFDYFDTYATDAPSDYVQACGSVAPMVALGPGDGPEQARALVGLGIGALELSTLEPERYGTDLSLATLARLRAVASAVNVPVVVPTQHHLQASDLSLLADAGAAAVLLGAVVLGKVATDYTSKLEPYVAAATNCGVST
ncbi:hypothetical protein [Pseudactinotalea sp. Z1748]|uniref:hypothetical protein n=1 Tax=Pseudactinotalea sp. Z1748 TaxID=3413027 RepID=UPI003C7EA290